MIDNVSLWAQKAVQKQEQEEEGVEHQKEKPRGVEAGVNLEGLPRGVKHKGEAQGVEAGVGVEVERDLKL